MPKKKRKRPTTLRNMLLAELGARDVTLHQVAKRAEVSPQVIYRFVDGSRQELRLSTIDKLLAYFEVELTSRRRR